MQIRRAHTRRVIISRVIARDDRHENEKKISSENALERRE